MIFGLYGIEGLYNFGCEAIVRGLEKRIHKDLPEAKLFYFSRMPKQDAKMIEDIPIEIIGVRLKSYPYLKVLNKGFRLLNTKYRVPDDDFTKIVNECDVIISIGGDIYTVPKTKLAKRRKILYNKLVFFGDYALKHGKQILIEGASIGPFGDSKKLNNYYFSHLKKIRQIIVRENDTMNYLRNNGLTKNVCIAPDPAFLLAQRNHVYRPDGYIALNISPLAFKSVYGNSEFCVEKSVELICRLSKKLNKKIIMIPHVLSEHNQDDNDYAFIKQIYAFLPEDVKKEVSVPDSNGLSFLSVKCLLVNASFVIAARMHCAINAISEAVPTLLLSYSSKSEAMARYIYRGDQYVISVEREVSEIVERTAELFSDRLAMHEKLNSRMNEICAEINDSHMYRMLFEKGEKA